MQFVRLPFLSLGWMRMLSFKNIFINFFFLASILYLWWSSSVYANNEKFLFRF